MTTPQPQQNKNKVTRFEVIDETGRIYVNNSCKIELSYQDDDRTLKVFVEDKKSATPTVDEKFQEIFGKYEPVESVESRNCPITPELTEEQKKRLKDAFEGCGGVMYCLLEDKYSAHLSTELELQRRELETSKECFCPIHNVKMVFEKLTAGGGGFDPVTKVVANDNETVSFVHETFKCPKKGCRSKVLIVKKSIKEALL